MDKNLSDSTVVMEHESRDWPPVSIKETHLPCDVLSSSIGMLIPKCGFRGVTPKMGLGLWPSPRGYASNEAQGQVGVGGPSHY